MSLVIVWARLRCVILYVLYVEYVKITELLRVNTDKNVQFNSHGKIICTKAGAHYKEPATPIISQCSDIFTDLSIFKYFCHEIGQFQSTGPGGGGGGTPLYGLYRYVRPQRVWFFSRFGHK